MDKKKNIVIGTLLAIVLLMSVGYAALAQVLTINGTANIDANWDVEITSITEGTLTGATTVGTPSYNSTSASFEVNLQYPGAKATYVIDVENKGTINAVLDSISGIDTANAANPIEIQYEVTGVTSGDELNSGDKKQVTVTVTWVSSAKDTIPTETSKTATVTLNYVQNT